MVKLNISGYIHGTSGYASHTRQLVNAIYKLNPDISLKTQLFPGYEKHLNRNELRMVENKPFKNGSVLAILLPPQWPVESWSAGSRNLGYCIWEGSNIPSAWLGYFADERVTNIIVPGNHTKQSIINTLNDSYEKETLANNRVREVLKQRERLNLIRDKIVIVPHGVDTTIFKPLRKKLNDGIFRFMANKGWSRGMSDRGGIQFLIVAFNQEFARHEPVELMIKINAAYNDSKWFLETEINKLGLRHNGGKLSISIEALTFEQLSVFYNYGDVFVSPNMSEGFGLPIAEAMVCGLPAITTNYGGQTDYVNERNGWLIDYELVDVTWDSMYKGVRWAMPDLIHLKKLMRYAFEHQEEVSAKGIQAEKDIEGFSWENSAKSILKLLSY